MKMKFKTIAVASAALLLFCLGCLGGQLHEEKKEAVIRSGDGKIRSMLDAVKAFNSAAPDTISASMTIEGSMKTKKFKALGNAQFDRKAGKMALAFIDFIFKSPITHMFQDRDVIYFYFPAEKKIFKDNINTINLLNYSTINLDYKLVQDLATGRIPVLAGYTVKDGLASPQDNKSYLILENDAWYETISFSSGQPDRIKLMNKKTREEVEIYLKKKITSDSCSFFRQISIVIKNAETRIDVQFDDVKLNKPIMVKTISEIKLPRDVQTIGM